MPKKTPQTTHSLTLRGETFYIRRKGSWYNIFGPSGYLLPSFKSAGVVGPRWEELTHTPWPHRSSAYAPGTRLRDLGIVPDEAEDSAALATEVQQVPVHTRPTTTRIVIPVKSFWALPEPRIDLEKQDRTINALRQNPGLLFDTGVRRALYHEVEYHRPNADWAQRLLNMLSRYDRRQAAQPRTPVVDPEVVKAQHIAWQEQRIN
ncbi:MAG: hypothetical protein GYB65_21225 [Chloroflexi bacterium]|nr:hypothetical protein [Chloroflexota bacterium]